MTPSRAFYTCYNQNCRISELESVIAIDSFFSYCYARDVIKGRFMDGEKNIATDLDFSYLYARNVIKGRFIEGEKIIATDLDYSYMYARDVIKGRWVECEKNISTDAQYSYLYARDIIKNPFDLFHPIIFSSIYKKNYIDFLKSINYDLHKIVEWLI